MCQDKGWPFSFLQLALLGCYDRSRGTRIMRLNKERVRLRFSRAAGTYDQQAMVQLQVADHLVQLLEENVTPSPAQIMEIGCCTGLLTERLSKLYPQLKALFVNDLVPDFAPVVGKRLNNDPRLHYLAGDIEHIDIPQDLDLVASSSTLHWLEDLPALLKKLHQCIVPGGSLCFSIYGSQNLREVREVTGVGLDYLSREGLQNLVADYFDIISCSEDLIPLHFSDPLAMLYHLRETGVNALAETNWTKSRLDSFLQEYLRRFGSWKIFDHADWDFSFRAMVSRYRGRVKRFCGRNR